MKPDHILKLAGLITCTFLATAGISTAQDAVPAPKLTAEEMEARRAQALKNAEELRRMLLRIALDDKDDNGWGDSWEKKWSEHVKDRDGDPDGDGITNWDEMLDGTDPGRPNKKGEIYVTPEEKAEQERKRIEAEQQLQAKREREWPAKQLELAKTLAPSFDGKAADPDHIRHDSTELAQKLAQRKAQADANMPVVEAELDEIARKHGIGRAGTDGQGRGWTLVGESPHGPLVMTTQDARSANSINADDVWPVGLHSWQNTAQTRNLTGLNVTTSIFEAGSNAGIRTAHVEFGARASQPDGSAISLHATSVADAIAGGGVLDVFRNSTNLGRLLRGTAYQSNVRGHDLSGFVGKSTTSVTDGHRFSNHSYGLSGGWEPINLGGTWYWFWPRYTFAEEPRFGMYSSTSADNISSRDLDAFVASSLVQLPVYASGNPNNYGPGAAPSPFHVIQIGSNYYSSTATRDWVNGDDGYDTVLSPATAKNVLTVGSITDVNAGSVSLSYFSGTGPTDDGRIKPDVVAVGQRNSALGLGDSLFLAHGDSNNAYYNGITPDSAGTIYQAGTSFAAPQVTGALALAQQRRSQLFPTAGAALASTWRALAIHTAQDIGAAGPDFLFGWGIGDTVGMVERLEQDSSLGRGSVIKEFNIAQGVSKTFLVNLPANTAGRFTLAWTDPAGTPAASDTVVDATTKMLVNDIDIQVQDTATNTVHYPWTLNPDLAGESAAVRGQAAVRTTRDNTNNVERIDVDASASARVLKVTVSPFGTITGGPQKVSLVLSGASPVKPKEKSFGLTQNPNDPDELAFTFENDPGAYFTLQVSDTLQTGSWTDVSTMLADNTESTLLVSRTAYPRRFWRVRRGQ